MPERPLPRLTAAQYQAVREKVDGFFVALSRRLDDCYYGTALDWDTEGAAIRRSADGWRHGVSHPFDAGDRHYDVAATPEGSKRLFDKLHGLIWCLHEIALADRNQSDGNPYPRLAEAGADGRTVRGRAADIVAALKAEGIEILPDRLA